MGWMCVNEARGFGIKEDNPQPTPHTSNRPLSTHLDVVVVWDVRKKEPRRDSSTTSELQKRLGLRVCVCVCLVGGKECKAVCLKPSQRANVTRLRPFEQQPQLSDCGHDLPSASPIQCPDDDWLFLGGRVMGALSGRERERARRSRPVRTAFVAASAPSPRANSPTNNRSKHAWLSGHTCMLLLVSRSASRRAAATAAT